MDAPYRSPAPRDLELKPLPPEEEMRLLLSAPDRRCAARIVRIVAALGSVAFAVLAFVDPAVVFMGGATFFAFSAATLLDWWRRRKRIRHLRAAGFDLSGLEEAPPCACVEAVRVGSSNSPPPIEAIRAVDEESSAQCSRART